MNTSDKKNEKTEETETLSNKNVYTNRKVILLIIKVFAFLICLYFFVCSLDLMSSAFRAIGGAELGRILSQNDIFVNPLAELMMGIVMTVVLQSSSTTTSIIITMIASEVLKVEQATYMIMGANIGTSITNSFVSLGHVNNRKEFRRAFSGATVHDMFNWLSVIVFMPLELISKYLQRLTHEIVKTIEPVDFKNEKLLKAITQPLTNLVIQIDKKVINDPAKLKKASTVLKIWCEKKTKGNETEYIKKCTYMFINVADKWKDPVIGVIVLCMALVILIICLIGLVRLLKSIFLVEGTPIHNFISRHSALNKEAEEESKKKKSCRQFTKSYLLGYVLLLAGCAITILVQSSSVTTSAFTPLVGAGLISLDTMYAISLGANIGTTITGMLSALAAADSSTLRVSIQTALIHLFFNISGVLVWYPIPQLRAIPLSMAKRLGKSTSNYRWFAVFYLLTLFFIFPVIVFLLSLVVWYLPIIFVSIILAVTLVVSFIKLCQNRCPQCLPNKLKTWKFLPRPLRSLKPYDRIIVKCLCCKRFKQKETEYEIDDLETRF